MSDAASKVVSTARDYYNSADADNFYALVWGGEDIHVGLYRDEGEEIAAASHRTVEEMAAKLGPLGGETRVLDLGSGYGGAARHLAGTHGVQVTALNLSEVENGRHRELNKKAGLAERIEVVDGNFEAVPGAAARFDVVWSQDAILHSGDRRRVLREVDRVLKPGGQFIFTDPMQADDCPAGVLQPILDRIHLDSLGSPGFYRAEAAMLGWSEVGFNDHTPQLANHYQRVLEETVRAEGALRDKVSPDYIARMKKGLGHWVEGGRAGHLAWGILHFRKPL